MKNQELEKEKKMMKREKLAYKFWKIKNDVKRMN